MNTNRFILIVSCLLAETASADDDKPNNGTDWHPHQALTGVGTISASSIGITLGLIMLFVILRPRIPRVYLLRSYAGEPVYNPEAWLRNMFFVKTEEAFEAGVSLDGCMLMLAWTLALRIFIALVVLSPIPFCINWFSNLKSTSPGTHNATTTPAAGPANHTGLAGLTLNLEATGRDELFWGHVATIWLITIIVIYELTQANIVFTKLRAKWLLARPSSIASSVMVLNVSARSDKEFKDTFERVFPGKIVDAQLIKFCPALAKVCSKLDALEEEIRMKTIAEQEKNTGTVAQTEDLGEHSPEISVEALISPDLLQTRAELRAEKKRLQDDVFLECVKESARVEELRLEEPDNSAHGLEHLAHLGSRLRDVANKIRNDEVFSKVGFVTFTDIRTATLAMQACYANNGKYWRMHVAPEPRDVLWGHGATNRRSTNQSLTFLIFSAAAIMFFVWSLVVSALQGWIDYAFNQINEATKNSVSTSFAEPFVSTLTMTIFIVVLPWIFYLLSVKSGRMVKNRVLLEVHSYFAFFSLVLVLYAGGVAEILATWWDGKLCTKVGHDLGECAVHVIKSVFGLSALTQYPKLYSYAAKSFIGFSVGVLLLYVYLTFALQYLILRKPWNLAWTMARSGSTAVLEYPMRFVSLMLILAIGLLVYQVFPLSAFPLCLLALLGSVTFRYRVLYTDTDLVDSGGRFWRQFELHMLGVLFCVQLTWCLFLGTRLGGIAAVFMVGLPVISAVYIHKMRLTQWRFIPIRHPDLCMDGHICTEEFAYVQPQLKRDVDADVEAPKKNPLQRLRD